eukprot:Rhum_TRINITY_DN15477_c0_g1::Rhum_TRINITY_DN15477_c0_g1_i7::g.158851::m.158851
MRSFFYAAAAAAVASANAQCSTWETDPVACVRNYNVAWDSLLPETDGIWTNGMPLGSAFAASNVWSDGASTVSLLLSSGEAWNEGAQIIKVGKVDVAFSPQPAAGHFKQTLDLGNATVLFELGGLRVQVWMDAVSNTTVVRHHSVDGVTYTAKPTVELIRPNATEWEGQFECSTYHISKDVLTTVPEGQVFYHRNEAEFMGQNYFRDMCDQQNLGPDCYTSLPNVMLNRTTGALVSTSGSDVLITTLTAQTATPEHYVDLLTASVTPAEPAAHAAWWAGVWQRSHIEVANDKAVSEKLFLQRYLQASQGRASFPIKFNGMLYTAQKPPHTDARQWGGRNWWQNARLPYYNMFAAGDFEMVDAFVNSYFRTLPLAKVRASHYFNTTGGAFWHEYTDAMFGTTHSQSYGCDRAGKSTAGLPYWYTEDPWNHYNLQGSLDLSLFALDYHSHTGDDKFLEIAAEVVSFYSQWRKGRDAHGKMILYPTQAIETWQCPGYPPTEDKCATNDLPTIAGLLAVVEKLLLTSYGTAQQRAQWRAFQAIIPPLPIATVKGASGPVVVPCEKCPPSTSNVENAELYSVHPYRLYTVGRGNDLGVAVRANAIRRFKSDDGWNQCIMDAALLGLAASAKSMAQARAAVAPAKGYRFPGFMPHLQDYPPSADHLSNLNNGVSYMVVQEDDTAQHKVTLLPAWPCSWDAHFKVHAPLNTVVAGSFVNGTLTYTVTPASRKADVTVKPCQK